MYRERQRKGEIYHANEATYKVSIVKKFTTEGETT